MLPYHAELGDVRAFAAARAHKAGLPPQRVNDLIIAVSELAANTLAHTRGPGTLTVWTTEDEFVCQIQDSGHLTDPRAGQVRPDPASPEGGRGLWVVYQVCDRVQISEGHDGTTIRLHMRRGTRPA